MLNRDSEIVICSKFVNCELWSCDMNSTLGSVVPLAMFIYYISPSKMLNIWCTIGTTVVWEAILSGEATGSLNRNHHRSMGCWLDSVCLLMPAASTVLTHQETWNLSKNLHDRIFRPNILHTKLWLFLLKMKERKCIKISKLGHFFFKSNWMCKLSTVSV